MSTANEPEKPLEALRDVSWHVPMLSTTAARQREAQTLARHERGEANRAYIRLALARDYPVTAELFAKIESEVIARLIRDGTLRLRDARDL